MNSRTSCLSFVVIMVLFLAACSRTSVIRVWKKGDFAGPPMQSVMIFAQTGDEYSRPAWENIMAERFRQSRMNAVAAVNVFPQNTTASLDQAIAHARAQGIEGVLVIRHVDTRMEERYHPPEMEYYYSWRDYYPLRRDYHPRYWGRYRCYPFYYRHYPYYPPYFYFGQEVVITPGYTTYHRVVLVESYLYQTSSGEQVWSMSTGTYDPRSDNYLVADISRSLFRVLRRYGLIMLTR